jgi:hypothetical protein
MLLTNLSRMKLSQSYLRDRKYNLTQEGEQSQVQMTKHLDSMLKVKILTYWINVS